MTVSGKSCQPSNNISKSKLLFIHTHITFTPTHIRTQIPRRVNKFVGSPTCIIAINEISTFSSDFRHLPSLRIYHFAPISSDCCLCDRAEHRAQQWTTSPELLIPHFLVPTFQTWRFCLLTENCKQIQFVAYNQLLPRTMTSCVQGARWGRWW